MSSASIALNASNPLKPLACSIGRRCRRQPLYGLITNIGFYRGSDHLADGPLAMAFLDRLVEGPIIIKMITVYRNAGTTRNLLRGLRCTRFSGGAVVEPSVSPTIALINIQVVT